MIESKTQDAIEANQNQNTTVSIEAVSNERLPPQDRGLKAYLFLFGASIVEITAWGEFLE